jgi:hypothetical protein
MKLLLLYILIPKLSALLLLIVRLKLLKLYNISKQEGLYNKVDNVANTTDPPLSCLLY